MKLVIVESPSKAKTIERYLGRDYTVRASVGHIRDLPKSNKAAIDIEHGFVPHYVVTPGKEKVIAELKGLVSKADEVYLATDPDREGEAIAQHLLEVLERSPESGVRSPKFKRVTFNEITEKAVREAFSHPREIDKKLVKAQEARRVLDRLVGYDLSGLIWKKVRYGLSAGRVQSPALRILMEREREIRAFRSEKYWVITANTLTKGKEPITFNYSQELKTAEEAERVASAARTGSWQVSRLEETAASRAPRPPFITSTLQQAASTRLGFSPSKTMGIAQKLYEQGHITYMRTDSLNLSGEALAMAARVIEKKFGKEYLEGRTYKTKSKNAQEAHEAIRPSHIDKQIAGSGEDQKSLYKLIWERTLASQMKEARLLKTKITGKVDAKGRSSDSEGQPFVLEPFTASGSRLIFDGWLAAEPSARGEDIELPKVTEGEPLECLGVESLGKETEPPKRYSEAGLIKELEKRGIGRPSTYASITKTIVDRGYVQKDGRSLVPTDTGDVVSSFLEQDFPEEVGDKFTAEMENDLDKIAEGEKDYEKTLTAFYKPFAKKVREKGKVGKITTLGEVEAKWSCPVCGGKMVWKLGRLGRFMSCERFPECSGGRTAEGLEIKGPQETGEICPACGQNEGGKLVERTGRYGHFVACSRYPKCRYVKDDEQAKKRADTGVRCPVCKKGTMTERRGRFGLFYGCSNYPECKNIIKSKPTGKLCQLCGSLMMEGTPKSTKGGSGDQPAAGLAEYCSNKQCPKHNPHRKKSLKKF